MPYESLESRSISHYEYLVSIGTEVFDEMPEGWGFCPLGACAPRGFRWINNRQSLFGGKYRHALLKIKY